MLRLSALWQYLKGALWVLPALLVSAAVAGGTLLAEIRVDPSSPLHGWIFGGSADSARQILSVIAGAMMTVAALTFSMTVVALQMASGQYSPRVLRGFLTDRGNQAVLGVFLATFAYSLAVIRVTRGEDALGGAALPRLAVTAGFVLMAGAMAALVYFLHHLTQQLRVETIMQEIVRDTGATIERVHERLDPDSTPPHLPEPSGPATRITARRPGYLQAVSLEALQQAAEQCGVLLWLRIAVGTHIAQGTTLAWAWGDQGGLDEGAAETVSGMVHRAVQLGRERTMQQDVAFGVRQLVDIAAKALSPGVNDPTTAVEVMAHLSELVTGLAGRRLGTVISHDQQGRVRVVVPRPTFAEYLELVADQPRRYGAGDPVVLRALLTLFADAAEVVRDDAGRDALRTQALRTAEIAERELDQVDFTRVQAAVEHVLDTLRRLRQPLPEAAAE